MPTLDFKSYRPLNKVVPVFWPTRYMPLRRGGAFRPLQTFFVSRYFFVELAAWSGLWESATTTEDLVDAADEQVCLERFFVLSTIYLMNCCHRNLTYITTSGNDTLPEKKMSPLC